MIAWLNTYINDNQVKHQENKISHHDVSQQPGDKIPDVLLD